MRRVAEAGVVELILGQSPPVRPDAAADSLREFACKIDTGKWGEPGVLAVITATGLAYRRKGGVHVVPLGTLGP